MNNQNTTTKQLDTIVTLDRIIYPKGSQGECWGIVKVTDTNSKGSNNFLQESITLKGDLPPLDYGETYKVVANPVNDKYGESYEIVLMLPYKELNNDRQWKLFLGSILTETQVVSLFRDIQEPVKAIKEHNIIELCKVKGIKETTANKIIEKYEDNKLYEQAFAELCQYNLSLNLIKKIVGYYGSINTAINIIKTNPYDMASKIDGIGFLKADEIGKKIGISNDSEKRIEGYILWYLEQEAQSGNSWLSPNMLCTTVYATLELSNKQALANTLSKLKQAHKLYWNAEKTYVCLQKYYDLEMNIAKELKRITNTKQTFKCNTIDDTIKDIEDTNGWQFTEQQKDAVSLILDNPIALISGYSGSGKSSVVEAVVKCLKQNYTFVQMALSGRASSRLAEITNEEGKTIHRALEYDPQSNQFARNQYNQLAEDIIIVDEISLVGGEIFYDLIKSIKNGAKLIMLGDHYQLPSIGCMNLLKDMIESEHIPKIIFNKIFRQQSKSAVITESFKVKDGIQITEPNFNGIEVLGENQDLILDCNKDKELTLEKTVEYFKRQLHETNDIKKIQVIGAMNNKGSCCIYELNKAIQKVYNGSNNIDKITIKNNGKDIDLKIGDRVINNQNNYNTLSVMYETTPIFNGFLGTITQVHKESRQLIVDFDNIGEVIIESKDIGNINLAYAINTWKFQGSQTERIIVAFNIDSYVLLTKEFIYTSMTRCKKLCIICCDNKALRLAISKTNVATKQTFLKYFLNLLFNNKQT